MADVNFFDAFGYKWALVGPTENLQDDQYKVGWSFIGAVPPSVEQFNRVHQVADEKANYLYSQMQAVFSAAGQVPTAVSLNTLRDSLRGTGLFQTAADGTSDTKAATTEFVNRAAMPRQVIFTSNGGWLVPPGITQVLVSAVGGGGGGGAGGGGSASFTGSGGGGGGAGRSEQRVPYAVVPGQTLAISIGAGGSFATGGTSGGASGGAGGNTTITNLGGGTQTFQGGGAGVGGANASSTTVPGPLGGAGWPAGAGAGDGTQNAGTGYGGAGGSPPGLGSGGSGGRAATGGNAITGSAPAGFGAGGGGGGGYYGSGVAGTFSGGNGAAGAPGIVVIEW